MSAGEECRKALKIIEEYERGMHHNLASVERALSFTIFSVKGEKPTALEEAELLDIVCTMFSLKRDDMLNLRIFWWLFFHELDAAKLYFLTRLTSLAICLPVMPVLEIAAVWLKCQPSQHRGALSSFCTQLLMDIDRIRLFNRLDETQQNTSNGENDPKSEKLCPFNMIAKTSPTFFEAFVMSITESFGFISESRPVEFPSLFTLRYLGRLQRTNADEHSPSLQLLLQRNASDRALDFLHWLQRNDRPLGSPYNPVVVSTIHALSQRSALGGLIKWVVTFPLARPSTASKCSRSTPVTCAHSAHQLGPDEAYEQAVDALHLALFQCLLDFITNTGKKKSSSVVEEASGDSITLPVLTSSWLRGLVDLLRACTVFETPASPTSEMEVDSVQTSAVPSSTGHEEVAMKVALERLAEYVVLTRRAGFLSCSSGELKDILEPFSTHNFIRVAMRILE